MHYKKAATSVSTLRRARKQHLSNLKNELSNLSPSSKTWWHLVKSVSGVCSPSIPSLFPLQMALQPTSLRGRLNASILCLLPNLVSPTPHTHTSLSYPDYVSFEPKKVEEVLSTLYSDSATGPDSISSHVLKTCSAAIAHPPSAPAPLLLHILLLPF